jgi:hypothetical protein
MRTIVLSAIVAGALIVPAHAGPTCVLEVDGQRLLDGSCDASKMDGDRLVVGDHNGIGALVRPSLGDSDHAAGAYKAEGQLHDLGPLERDGVSCWRNARVRLCAWGAR